MPSPSSQASRKKRALAIDPSITTSVQPPALNASSTLPNCPSFTQVQASTMPLERRVGLVQVRGRHHPVAGAPRALREEEGEASAAGDEADGGHP